MFDYDSEEYFTHGTATVDAIEKILEPEHIVWADWVKDTQGFVYRDPEEDDRSVLFDVELIVEKVEATIDEDPDVLDKLEENEIDSLDLWLQDHGVFIIEEVR